VIAAWLAAAIAITGATVYTGEGEPLERATVVIEGTRIQAVGRGVAAPPGARVIDARGAIVTPGLIDAESRLGLEEVETESTSIEAVVDPAGDPVRAALRAADGFEPRSITLPPARASGITSAVIVPAGGLISGQSAWIDLVERDPVRRASLALHVNIGADAGAEGQPARAGARALAFMRLRELFADARLYGGNRGPFLSGRLRALSTSAADVDVLARAQAGQLRVVFRVDRSADILRVLELAQREKLRAVLAGAAEGWLVAKEIAAAGVPAIVDPLDNLPATFDELRACDDNAARLHAAGVRVALSGLGDAHRAHRLRHAAGNAVAQGLPRAAALAAITRVPAEIFDVRDTGSLRPGALANLVIWNGDPLELDTWPTHVFAHGRELDLDTRQDALTRRYLRGP
jgi:imidazolonepropionase-like amidohydrolase